MKINELIRYNQKPKLYEKGSAVMWTDPHISEQLLQIHLHPELDLASRKLTTIKSTVDWVLTIANNEQMNILDLGCGPGLYSEIFATKGHKVTGVDFSENSINYAKKEAINKGLGITYLHQNYLELDVPENTFDLVTLIYADLGVLNPNERSILLANIKKTLKPGGIFIFDVLNDKDLDKKVSPKNWEVTESGFWRPNPYIALSESFLYESEKVVLNQHVVSEDEQTEVYRFWTHFFSHDDISEMLAPQGFTIINFHEEVLPLGDIWNGDNVTFCITTIK
ncbi:MAG: class I SAM-dependent methyltransferase [Bacteroidales bacterium]|nr:class I SAM-dependent methyltransferase [Bacteroidales bacterium]